MGCPEQYEMPNHGPCTYWQLQCIGGDGERGPTPMLATPSGPHLCVEAEPLVCLAEVLAHGSSMRTAGGLRTSHLGPTHSKEASNHVVINHAQLPSAHSLIRCSRNVARGWIVGLNILFDV